MPHTAPSDSVYIALCPDALTRARLTDMTRQAKGVLGQEFIAQHPANFHLTTGRLTADNMPRDFPISASDVEAGRYKPLVKRLSSPLSSDVGEPYLDLFYRPETQEFSLALCLPFTAASAWKNGVCGEKAPPHITLGKMLLDEGRNTAEVRNELRQALHCHEGLFAPFAAWGDSIRDDYARGGVFSFDAMYLAPAGKVQPSVPRGPVLPECGKRACR